VWKGSPEISRAGKGENDSRNIAPAIGVFAWVKRQPRSGWQKLSKPRPGQGFCIGFWQNPIYVWLGLRSMCF
jgi:hypothetical protein